MRVALHDPRPQIGMREKREPLFKNSNRLVRYDHFGNLKSAEPSGSVRLKAGKKFTNEASLTLCFSPSKNGIQTR
jgi:hypothetical protein